MLQRDVRHLPLMREFKTDEPITPKDVFTVLSMEHFSRFMVPLFLSKTLLMIFVQASKPVRRPVQFSAIPWTDERVDGSIHFPAHIQPMRLVLEQMRDLNQMILNINVDEDVSVAIAVNDMVACPVLSRSCSRNTHFAAHAPGSKQEDECPGC